MRGTAASPWSRRPSWTPRARSSGWRGCEQAAGADRPRPADRDRPRAVRGLRRLRQGGAGRVRIGRRVGRLLPRPGGGRARAAAARVRCLPRGRDRGVGRDRPPDRPRESQPKPPVVTGLRLVIRSEEHTSELQSLTNLVCRLLLEKKKKKKKSNKHNQEKRKKEGQAHPENQQTRRIQPYVQTISRADNRPVTQSHSRQESERNTRP